MSGTTGLPESWAPDSWRSFPAEQPVDWPDPEYAAEVRKRLAEQPPLIFAGEARDLTDDLASVAAGKAFLLQAGDCAESFEGVSADTIRDQIKVILQMALILTYGAGVPVVKVARMAGQYAKPRSELIEMVDGNPIPAFRGHILNSESRTADDRALDPDRMIRAYNTSTATNNLLRAFTTGGFASLTQVHEWNREFVASSAAGERYESAASNIDRAIQFVRACGVDTSVSPFSSTKVFTSHEALLLDYEEPLTRTDSLTGQPYGCSAHQLWVGERTRRLDGADIEFVRGLSNPIGVKIGPSVSTDDVVALCERINPERVPGRLSLITRMGAEKVTTQLPPVIDAVQASGHPVVWVCDPMHGNTYVSPSGKKTRRFDAIFEEVGGFFAAHHAAGTWPGGIHLEMTSGDVTECIGGSDELGHDDLAHRYDSLCDPRLNGRQALELAFRVSDLITEGNAP